VTEDWQPCAAALADALARSGDLRDPTWHEAFTRMPRHVFLPGRSMDVAYCSSEAIVTQTRPAFALGGDRVELPTSSASAPAAMAMMLDRLDVRDGHRVLEVGTGTGYNAGLLCHRLGDDNVYSIDIDPDLVHAARLVLASLGYHPTLAAGNGHRGIPDGAPYDAIIATCAITHVPPAWIRQLKPGGRMVAPLHGGQDAALMVLDKTADDEVSGRFDPQRASFMPLRTALDSPLPTPRVLSPAALAMPHYGTTDLDPNPLVDPAEDLILFLHLHIPGLTIGASDNQVLGKTVGVSDPTSSAEAALVAVAPQTWTVIQRGPRRLWDTIEHATRLWHTLGQPSRQRLGITALDDIGRQYVWLDDPDGPYSWPMPL
jgi:protein-L-isoaspartate(D-aspartate) O-methyltransferase